MASSQVGMHSHDGIDTVLSLDSSDNGYLVRSTERRPADKGKITQLWSPQEETLILEDGGVIEIEEPANFLRFDERLAENVYYQGDYGERILNESDGTLILLETATSINQVQHFVSERSIEMESVDYIMKMVTELLWKPNRFSYKRTCQKWESLHMSH